MVRRAGAGGMPGGTGVGGPARGAPLPRPCGAVGPALKQLEQARGRLGCSLINSRGSGP